MNSLAAYAGILLLLTIIMVDAVPRGFVTWFEGSTCPPGYVTHLKSRGRLVVATADASRSGLTVGTPLGNLALPQHSHSYRSSIPALQSKDISASDGQETLTQGPPVAWRLRSPAPRRRRAVMGAFRSRSC
jgi:hypothetical protein